jgi:hypothetical protein
MRLPANSSKLFGVFLGPFGGDVYKIAEKAHIWSHRSFYHGDIA